ncbi:hypothetical protein AMTRI_Chr01g109790 [Amborella trichopoda]
MSEEVEGKVDWKGRPAAMEKHGGFSPAMFILASFAFENLATLALAVNLVTYFNAVMHFGLAEAANSVTNYMGTGYLLSVLVACIADAYVGRFRTVLITGCIELLGFILLTIQAHSPQLKPAPCNIFVPNSTCSDMNKGQAAMLFSSLYMIGLGSAGIKAGLPSHGADQFDEKDPEERKQMSSFFNWLLLSVCLGGAMSLTFIVWIQTNRGWDWGFGASAVAMLMAVFIFASGTPNYRIQVVKKTNPLIEIVQVLLVSLRNRKLQLPENHEDLYELNKDKESAIEVEFLPHRNIYRFLDKAAVRRTNEPLEQAPSPWKLCRVTQVEQAKIIFGMVPIFCCSIFMSTCLAQLQTFSVQQGLTMDTRITKTFKIPPASLPIIPLVFMIILIPIYDRVIVPLARKFTGHPTGITHLQRIGVGLVLAAISMGVAGIVEVKRKNVALKHGMIDALPVLQPLPISTFWLTFQYFIFGIADIFTYVGLLEFFYSEAPPSIKSISTAFLWCSMGLGYFLSTILVQAVNLVTERTNGGWLSGNNLNRNSLNLFYWFLCALNALNFFHYLFWAKRYKYRPQPFLNAEAEKV